jgi:hypothetical protein
MRYIIEVEPFEGLCKVVFNHVWNYKDTHALWLDICAVHEGTKE